MAERSVKVILSAVDRLTAPINKITNSLKPMDAAVKRVNDNLRATDRETSKVVGSVNGATGAFSRMGRQIGRTSAEASKAIGKMGAFAAANDNLRFKLTRTAAAASAALGAMGAYSASVDKADRAQRRFSADRMMAGLRGIGSRAATAGRHLGDLVRNVSVLGAASAAGAAAGIAWLGKQVIDTSSTFERMAITLETVMGDKGKAQEALKWVSDFAQKTPFELKETSEAFVKLKSYGIDPMKGSLMNAGNAAAIMGKPLNQAVEALADAMTGENERLKEFGITAKIEGNKIQYNWMENGKAMTAFASKNSRDQMLAVINGIWNRQYKGGMDKLSMTWSGMLSNMGDAWVRITQQIGEAGLFDFLKDNLKQVLDYVTMLQDTGKLKEWATGISRAATEMLSKFKKFVTEIKWDEVGNKLLRILGVIDSIASMVGGPLNLALLTMGAMTFGPLITSFTMLSVTLVPLLVKLIPHLVTGFRLLTVAMMTNPAIAITTAFIALAAAAIYVGRNWEYFRGKFTAVMRSIQGAFSRAWDRMKDAYSTFFKDMMSFFQGAWNSFSEFWNRQWSEIVTNTQSEYQSIMDWLANFDMVAVGKDLVQRMWDGMKNKWDDLKKWFYKKVKGLFNFWNNKGEGDGDGPSTTGSIGSGGGAGGGRVGLAAYARGSASQPGAGRTSMGRSGLGTSGDASNSGGAQPSTAEGRGKANLMHGQYGGVGENQTQITTKSGRKVTVHKDAAASFKGFLDELEGSGYKINSLGGLAIRKKRGGSGWSQHAYGNAIDINPAKNPMSKKFITDLPPNISDMAAKHGLSWGGDWKSVKDTMHFEWRGTTPEERAKAAALKALDQKAEVASGHKHPFSKMGEYVASKQAANATEETGGTTDLRGKVGLTKGLNNNNYGNLKFNAGTAYKRYPGVLGPSENKDEGSPQIVFKSLEDGIQGTVNMVKRLNGEGRDTVNKMISAQGGWTPGKQFAADNIAKTMGVKPDETIDLSKPEVLKRFVKAVGKQEHGLASAGLDKKVDAVVDGIVKPLKAADGAANPTRVKSGANSDMPSEARAKSAMFNVRKAIGGETARRMDEGRTVTEAVRKTAGPNGAGVAAMQAAAAERAKGLTSGAIEYKPQINLHGVADKDIPKKVEQVTNDHSRELRQRQREALHD